MDGSTSSKFKIKQIKVGDIVKVMRYDIEKYSIPAYGIVVTKEETNQIYMFPVVEILLFGEKTTMIAALGTVEIISRA